MRQHTTWRLQNNCLNVDLFERSSKSPDTTETSSIVELVELVEMVWNNEGNARKLLSDYTRPLTKRIDVVVNCTPIRVNNNSKLTNFVKIS